MSFSRRAPIRSAAARVVFGTTIAVAATQIFLTNVTQFNAEKNPNVDDLRNVQLEFRVVDGSGAVLAFTSSIDNGTVDEILRVK